MAHRRSLGFPGFPVEGCGFEQLHVVLFQENHISGTGKSCEIGNPGTLGMTKRRGLLKGKGPLPRDRAVVGRRGRLSAILISPISPVDRPPGSNLARWDEVALEDCAAGQYGLHCPPHATAFALGNCDTLWHKVCTASWYEVVRAVFQVCF